MAARDIYMGNHFLPLEHLPPSPRPISPSLTLTTASHTLDTVHHKLGHTDLPPVSVAIDHYSPPRRTPWIDTPLTTIKQLRHTHPHLGSLLKPCPDQGSNPQFSPSPQSSQDLRYHQSHRHISLPPTVEGHVELNPLLLARHESLIRYSMASPPTTASAFGDNPGWMLEAATRPNLRSMTIASSELIPQPIIVHASTNPFIITIGDVLVAVHGALHTLVTEYEYRLTLLPNVAGWQVGNGYRNGMRRLDLLNGRFWWVGLSASQEGSEMWDLHLQR